MRDEFTTKFNTICLEYYKNKIKIAEAVENKKVEQPIYYTLEEDFRKVYSGETVYIEGMMFYLRKNQDLIYKILAYSKTQEQKNIIASFVVNFLYSNIFCANSIDEELLLLLYRTLKFEISNLSKMYQPDGFLSDGSGNNSINAVLLSNLIRNDDIKVYFSKILGSIISRIDGQDDNKLLTLDPLVLNDIIQGQKEKGKKQEQLGLNDSDLKKVFKARETISNDTFMTSDSESSQGIQPDLNEGLNGMSKEVFFSNYIPDLTKEELSSDMDLQKDQNMKEYIYKQLDELKTKPDNWFSNAEFINNVYKSNDSTEVLDFFHTNFSIVVDIINELFTNLIANIEIIPTSIRYISKIIATLIKEKFPKILQVELNAFIAKFFFGTIFTPIFTMADYSGLLKSTILLSNTKDNIMLIQKILQKLVGGSFFDSNADPNFTIINRFFIDAMPKVFEFFDKLINVKLPPLLEKITTNMVGADVIDNIPLCIYSYNFFKENPKEIIRDTSLCFNIDDILTILEIIKSNSNAFFAKTPFNANSDDYENFKGAFERLEDSDHMKVLLKIKKKDEDAKEKTYILIKRQEKSAELEYIYGFKNTHFQLKEIKKPKTEEEKELNIILKIKNALCKILFNFKEIPDDNFFGFPIENTEEFISALMKLAKINYYNLDTSVESDWFILSLKSLRKNLPPKYNDNDCAFLYDELLNDISSVLHRMDIKALGKLIEELRLAENNMKQTDKNVKSLEQIEQNNKIQNFLDTSQIEACMNFCSQKGSNKFIIKSSKGLTNNKFRYLDDFLFEKKKETGITCQNIFQFTKSFPNFSRIEQTHAGELFEYMEKFEVPQALKSYLNTVKSLIADYKDFFTTKKVEKEQDKKPNPKEEKQKKPDKKNQKNQKKEEIDEKKLKIIEDIHDIVANYIMNRIYDKIFPREPDQLDTRIYDQCRRLSWIETNHLSKVENLNLDTILPKTIGLIKELDEEKSPEGKMQLIQKVIQIILNNNTYCLGKTDGGVDDIIPMLIYVIIKAQPYRLSSNINYIRLFYGEGPNQNNQIVSTLTGIKDWILNIESSKLNGISETEFSE